MTHTLRNISIPPRNRPLGAVALTTLQAGTILK